MEDTQISGRVGPVIEAIGGEVVFRLGRQAEQIVSQAHGQYHEASANGVLYKVSNTAAGVAPGTALSTTPPLAIWNPPASGIIVSIAMVKLGYVSGTLGAGLMGHGAVLGQTTVPTGGTELTPQCTLMSGVRGKARAFSGSTLAATPILIEPSFSMGPALATTVAFPFIVYDEVNGTLLIPPGVCWVFQGVTLGGGTTPLVVIGATYEEIPIPQ